MATGGKLELGRPAADFALTGTDGRQWRLADLRGPRGTVVMFICNHCPYVKAVIDRIVRDMDELTAHGVRAVAVMPNDTAAYPEDSFERMKEMAARHRFCFPYLYDAGQDVARSYGAVCTPDFFGYDASMRLAYRGRLDSAGAAMVAATAAPPRRELFEAMAAVARGQPAPERQVPSIGCTIKWRA